MAIVVPFRAWRYNLAKVRRLSLVTAPPYDVIDHDLQEDLHRRNPYNVVRVDLGRVHPEDTETSNRYTRAAALLEAWMSSGVLVRDPDPVITMVEETFRCSGGRLCRRRGFLACLDLRRSADAVFPHEQTFSGPKEDRFRLMRETAMSLSPVFLLYSRPSDDITGTWLRLVGGRAPDASLSDQQGVNTRLWATADPELLATVSDTLADASLLIADGHHRFDTALQYMKARHEEGAGEGAWDYALVYLSNMDDPDLALYATHRMVAGLDPEVVRSLPATLSSFFDVQRLAEGPEWSSRVIGSFLEEHRDDLGTVAFYLPETRTGYGIRLRPDQDLKAMFPSHSRDYCTLDVTILHGIVFERVLGISAEAMVSQRNVTFVKEWEQAFSGLNDGSYQVGFFMNPTKIDQVRRVAFGGERLPQKSTYFYPKLPTGLVFHDLTDGL